MPTQNKTYSTVVGKTLRVSTRTFTEDLMCSSAIDLAFQSRTRWNYAQKQAFINSCLVDMSISKFILVDVAACLAVAVEKEDKVYFQGWLDQGVRYLIVDSNNRINTLKEFLKGLIKIPYGDYCIGDKEAVFKVDKDSNTYDTMDEDLREIFLSNMISTHIITGATRKQLSDVFQRMNSGESLNIYEKLNCSYSRTCEQIRDVTTKMSDDFLEAKLFGLGEINRRKIDGWLAQVFYLYVNGTYQTWTDAVRTAWYTPDSVSNMKVNSFVKDWEAFMALVYKKIKLFPHKWVYFDLFYQIKEQKDLGKRFVNKENIVLDFINMFTPLIADKTPKYFYPDKEIKKKLNKVEFLYVKGETVLFPFSELIKGEGGNTPTRFKAYEDAGWDITKYFTGELDKKRVATRIEKQSVAVRDDWKDSDGDDFIPEELFDGELDAGHVLARGNEGKTTPENMVIEKMSKNRGKGMETTEIV